MSTSKRKSKVKLISVLVIIAGALVVVAAGVTLGMVSSQLKAQHLTVTAMTPEGPASLTSKPAADPFHTYSSTELHPGSSQDLMTLSDTRDSLMNGSFLRALFLIAAVALCVAAPVMGIGVLFALVGFGPWKRSQRRQHTSAHSSG